MVHLVLLLSWLFSSKYINRKLPFYIFSYFALFAFMALRYNYGNDFRGYLEIHRSLNMGLPAWGQSDFLFYHLNLMIPNFYVFIAITSLFYIISVWFLISNNLHPDAYWFAFLILLVNPYLFLIQLSSLRQTLAICFYIFAVYFAVKRNLVLYVVFVVLASGMHASAIILLPIYFLLTRKNISIMGIILLITLLIILLSTPAFEFIITGAMQLLKLNYFHYYEEGLENSLRATILSSFYFLLVLFNMNKLKEKQIPFAKLALLSYFISILAFKLSMLTRVQMYFEIFTIIAIPMIFRSMKKGAIKTLLFAIMLTIYILRYYSFFANPLWHSFVKYQTIL